MSFLLSGIIFVLIFIKVFSIVKKCMRQQEMSACKSGM